MEVVIIRPPLVYGPGVKGNFLCLIKLVKLGIPLPLGAVHNKRSFVAGLLGKKDVADRLFGSLQVDSSKARDLLGWTPVVTMDEGLRF